MTKPNTKNIEVFVNATMSLAAGLGLDTEETLGAIFIIQRRLSKRENVPLLQFLQRIFDATFHVAVPHEAGKNSISKQCPCCRSTDIIDNTCTNCGAINDNGKWTWTQEHFNTKPSAKPEATKAKGKRKARK